MTRRLAIICLMTMLLIGIGSSKVSAQEDPGVRSLKGISAIYVLVEGVPVGAKKLGLNEEHIQTDVELKLRLAGMRVVTREEYFNLAGRPYLYIEVNSTEDAVSANIEVELCQNTLLARNGELSFAAATWRKAIVLSNPSVQGIRNRIKDLVDEFLNAWLSVNPKK